MSGKKLLSTVPGRIRVEDQEQGHNFITPGESKVSLTSLEALKGVSLSTNRFPTRSREKRVNQASRMIPIRKKTGKKLVEFMYS